MTEFTYTIKDDLGLHARPAGLLATKCASFKSKAVSYTHLTLPTTPYV